MSVLSLPLDLPDYHILDKLGVGAESRVFRARCARTGKDLAVKIVSLNKPEDFGIIELLRAEHAIGAAIQHPNLREVHELRMIRRRLRLRGAVLFMEYVEGIPMSDKEFRRPLDTVLALFLQVAEGLQAMHAAAYVHADLKPNNIMVTTSEAVKLIDFGQSARLHMAKTRIQGTIDYIAPEQVQRGTLDQRTDVFGLGAALHRVLTGRPVPTEMNQTVSIHSQSLLGKRLADVRETAMQELPICVSRLIEDCCRVKPEDRLSDMGAVLERLRLARTILARQAEASATVGGVMESDERIDEEDDLADDDHEPCELLPDIPELREVRDIRPS